MMGRDMGYKPMAIVALVAAITGISFGFAAFSNTLTIKSSAAVTPNQSAFNVDFVDVDGGNGPVVGVGSSNDVTNISSASINNSADPVISTLSATFKNPGDYVTYTFKAKNLGEYHAYLREVNYKDISTSVQKFIQCTGKEVDGQLPDDTKVQSACNGITVSVQVGSELAVTDSKTDYKSHLLSKGYDETVVVTIKYGDNATVVDGSFDVTFGDIQLVYSSVDNSTTASS